MRHLILSGAILAAVCAVPAASQRGDDGPSERVSFADLDLESEAGRRMLERRVGRASEYACGSYAGKREHHEIEMIDQCRRRATAAVERQIAAVARSREVLSASR